MGLGFVGLLCVGAATLIIGIAALREGGRMHTSAYYFRHRAPSILLLRHARGRITKGVLLLGLGLYWLLVSLYHEDLAWVSDQVLLPAIFGTAVLAIAFAVVLWVMATREIRRVKKSDEFTD